MSQRSLALALRSVVALMALVAATASAAPVRTADAVVRDLGGKTVDLLQQRLSPAEREARVHALLHDDFDITTMSRYALGNAAWRAATAAEREEFERLFEDYVAIAYGGRLGQYSGERFTVTGSRPEGESGALVSSEILRADGSPPMRIDWRVAAKSGREYRINDVIVGGISLVVTQHDEFASVLQHNGGKLEALLQVLREKTRH